jgi:hypothetical protein
MFAADHMGNEKTPGDKRTVYMRVVDFKETLQLL